MDRVRLAGGLLREKGDEREQIVLFKRRKQNFVYGVGFGSPPCSV